MFPRGQNRSQKALGDNGRVEMGLGATPYWAKLFWLWDDTGRAAGPLGSLAGCAATSEFPGKAGLNPSVGVNLNYFPDDADSASRSLRSRFQA